MAGKKNKEKASEAVKISVCGVLAALSFVLLSIGSLIEALDFSVVLIASFPILFCVVEMGSKYALLTWATTALVSFLLLPGSRFPALVYLLFGGIYPVLKPLFDKIKKPLRILPKLGFMAVDFTVIYLLSAWMFPSNEEFETVFFIAFALLTLITFLVYDLLLEKITVMYFWKWRKMLRIKGFK